MKRVIKPLALVLAILSTNAYADDADFSLHSNSVTILCPNATVGDTGVVNGVTYTKIDVKEKLVIHDGTVDATEACTSGVTDIGMFFDDKNTFDKDISHWDTSSVNYMIYMFRNATAFNQDIGDWNTSSVINMYMMFYNANAFNQDISNWCVSNINSKPILFDNDSAFENNSALQPIWGTCPIPPTTTSGLVFATQPEVEAVDEHGNIDTDYAGEVTLTKNGLGTLGGTVTKTASIGVIVYNDLKYTATADKETYTLTASDGSISGTSDNIISEVIATKLLFATQPSPTSIEKNIETTFTTVPVVKAVDADGLVDVDFVGSVTITEAGTGTGIFTNATATALSGVASFTGLTLNYDTDETFKLVATANSLTVNSTDLTATPDSTAPTISSLTIPNSSMKIGSVVSVTIIVPSDTDNYTTGSGAISGTVGGFTLGSFTKTNNTTYTATFTVTNGSTDVASGIDIPVSIKLTDSAGNQMATAFTTSITQSSDSIDANTPTLSSVTIVSNNADTTKSKVGDEITVTFTANETVALPTVTIAGKNATVVNTSGNIYTAKYTMVTGDITGGVPFTINFSDSATNAGTRVVNTTNSSSVLFDKTAPTIAIRTNDSSLKAGEVATLTFTLSENSTNFALADITVTGGILSNFAGNGISYTVDFTPTASSNTGATVDVASSKFTDIAGNGNSVATQLAMSVDTIAPTIAITSSHSSLKSGEVATLTFTLSENSTNFALADITVTGGTIASFTGSGNVYTVSFTPTASSTTGATVNVVANKFTNIAGNGNSVAPQITMSVDTLVPTLTSTSPVDNATGVSTTTNIVLTMSENVSAGTGNIIIYDSTNTQIESIPINDAKVTISGTTVTINPSTSLALNTLHYVKIANGVLVDASGNAYAGISDTTSWNFTTIADTTAPTISSLTIPNSSMKIGSVVSVTIIVPSDTDNYTTGSGAISGTVGGFTLGSFTKTNNTTYTATFTVTNGSTDVANGADIPVSIKLTDSIGNQMATAFTTSITQNSDSIDANTPTLSSVTIVSDNADTTKSKVGDEITVTFTANETVALPTVTIAGKNATVTNTSGNIYTAKYTMVTGDTTGVVPFTINFSDSATNAGTRVVNTTNSSSVLFDKTAPTIVIRTNDSSLKAGEVATLTFTLSENSTNFALADITVTGGTIASFAGSGNVYTVSFTPTASSTAGATVNVASSKFTDIAGNLNSVAPQITMTVDTVVPTVAISTNDSALKIGDVATLTFTLSENSNDFTIADIIVVGGTLSNFSGNGISYTADFTPTASSNTGATVDVASNKFTDTAGNGNSVATQLAMSVDTIAPTIAITSTHSSLKVGDVATITFTLSEASTNFITTDITVTGGILSNFAGSGISYTVDFTPTALSNTGAIVNVASSKFTDTAGNGNSVATQLAMSVDTVTPTLTSTSPTDNAIEVSITPNLVMTMSKNMIKGSGNIVIKKSSDDSTVETIAVTNSVINGVVVTIDLTITLDLNTQYYVQIASGVLKDSNDNDFSGILDKTTWSFTTTENFAPTVADTVSGQLVDDNDSISPFSTVTLGDNEGDNISINITLDDDDKGILSQATIASGDVASVQATLRAITFKPTDNRVVVGNTETTTFTITANDGILDSLADINTIVIAKSINDAPVINTVFNDINITENNGTSRYDINISDVDVLSELNLTIESNNTNILTVTPNWSGELNSSNWIKEFNLTTVENANGIVKITIRTTDGDVNVTKTFDVNVTAVDYAPVLEAIADIDKNEDSNNFTIRLNASDSDGDTIIYTATSQNSSIATVLIVGNTLTVTPIANANGVVSIDVNATSNGQTVTQTFEVNIRAVNDVPVISINSIENMTRNANFIDFNISLTEINDMEGDDLNISFDINDTSIIKLSKNWDNNLSHTDYVGAEFNLIVTSEANQSGVTEVTITISDGMFTFSKEFNITVVDTIPDSFNFTDKTDQARSSMIESNSVTVIGIDNGIEISITDGEYQINDGDWSDVTGTINNNDRVTVRLTSSENYNTTLTTHLSIGEITKSFSVITKVGNIIVPVNEDETTARFNDTLDVDVAESKEMTTATIEIKDKKIEVAVSNSGTMSGKIESHDKDGNSVTSSVKIDLTKSETSVDNEGNIDTTVKTDTDSTIKVRLGIDGSVQHVVESKGRVSIATSAIPGSKVEVNAEGNVETTAQIEKNGFIYKGVVITNAQGETQTKFSKIDVVTGKEVEVKNTLNQRTPYESGSQSEIVELDDLIFIKTVTPLDAILVVE